MDLVIQSQALAPAAVEAFLAAIPAVRVQRRAASARFFGVAGDAQSHSVAGSLARHWNCDAAFVPPALRHRAFRALVLDMDSTVITIECIDELARLAGKGAEVAAITAAAMRGEIADFSESLRQRVALLAGTDESVLERVRTERLRYSDGAARLLEAARAAGWKTLLVSGGFTVFANEVRRALGFDASCANWLVSVDGRLTGEVHGPAEYNGKILDAAGKAHALEQFCRTLSCDARQAIAIGDGANDLQMMALAGLSLAYRAKPVVKQQAAYALDHSGLDGVLNLFADAW